MPHPFRILASKRKEDSMKKRLIRVLSVLCIIACFFSVSAFAGSDKASYSFTLTSASSYSASAAAYKSDSAESSGAYASIYPSSGSYYSNGLYYCVKIYAQLGTDNSSTNAVKSSSLSSTTCTYYSSYLFNGNKYLCARKASSSGANISISGSWYP